MELNGKVALITGGAQGIGKIISAELARQGAHVILGDINFDGAEKTAEEIKRRGWGLREGAGGSSCGSSPRKLHLRRTLPCSHARCVCCAAAWA